MPILINPRCCWVLKKEEEIPDTKGGGFEKGKWSRSTSALELPWPRPFSLLVSCCSVPFSSQTCSNSREGRAATQRTRNKSKMEKTRSLHSFFVARLRPCRHRPVSSGFFLRVQDSKKQRKSALLNQVGASFGAIVTTSFWKEKGSSFCFHCCHEAVTTRISS